MGVGEGVVQYAAKLQSPALVSRLFDPPAGVREHTDIDLVLVHGIEVLVMVEGVEPHAPHIVLRVWDEIEEFTREGVKVSIDDHRLHLFANRLPPSFVAPRHLVKKLFCL